MNEAINIRSAKTSPKLLSKTKMDSTNFLVSFDTVSLFTTIPIERACSTIDDDFDEISNFTALDNDFFLKIPVSVRRTIIDSMKGIFINRKRREFL